MSYLLKFLTKGKKRVAGSVWFSDFISSFIFVQYLKIIY